ncbi:MAG: L,D-transpeptidase [Actinomyces sp.]|nr:MAG: L,D-transpeptidase [Actinomyces sp.]
MDRRTLLLGGLGLVAACAAPESSLLDDVDVDAIVLRPGAPAPSTTLPVTPDEATTSAPPEIATVPPEDLVDLSFVARAVGPTVEVHTEPDGALDVTLDNPIPSGGPLVFLVDELADGWYRVLVPLRPNGRTGWVRADQVSLTRHNYRLRVELSAFRLDAFDHGELFFTAPTGVARDNTPTPGGRYYITELLQPPEPDSVYGLYAYGLSGYSEVLETFAGGPGQLGIHGTNDPSTIGRKVSHGCIRLRNEDIAQLVPILPLGTPVEVIA